MRVKAQTFDTSGTASLKGQYLFRYVNFFNDQNGNLTESCTLTGAITFDGAGKYTLSNTQLADSAGTVGKGYCTSLGGGTYGVQSNGIAQLDNPLYPATLFGTFSSPVVIASSTEDDYYDLFIAVQAPASSSSNGLLSGAFTVGMLDFPNASASMARQGYFTLNADGNGNIAAFTVNGSAAEREFRQNYHAGCRGFHLFPVWRGRRNDDLSRKLDRRPADSSPEKKSCTSRPMATGSWAVRPTDRICCSDFARPPEPVPIRC